ncbi:MAG: hypothetical protein LBI18_03800 [Planctomycetaceae bacterium]|nr:hypothetical protein [Planctomycetaceae bacterium]
MFHLFNRFICLLMMKQHILLLILIFVVFFIGFLSGSFWQVFLQSQLRVAVEQPIVLPAETKNIASDNIGTGTTSKSTEEERVIQALTDPDFKRVHDFLIRESPMQMNLESKEPEHEH